MLTNVKFRVSRDDKVKTSIEINDNVKYPINNKDSIYKLYRNTITVPDILTEDLKEYAITEQNNIHKEKTRNRNQPYAFLNG